MASNANRTEDGERGEPKRWTATRKMEVILRHMRGEPLDSLSREIGVPASQIEEWHQAAIKGVEASLKSRAGEPCAGRAGSGEKADR